jgi:hypothetical protein
MTAEPNPGTSPLVRLPFESLGRRLARFGLLGLGLGLAVAWGVVLLDRRTARTVSPVCVEARALLLRYHAEKGAWPREVDLATPGDQFAGYRLERLAAALEACALPGRWTFVRRSVDGGPAIVFTPAESSGASGRVFAAVDAWIDDDAAGAGLLRVRDGVATFRLTDE